MTKRKSPKDGKVYENATLSIEEELLAWIDAQANKDFGGNRSRYATKIFEEHRKAIEKKENGNHNTAHKK